MFKEELADRVKAYARALGYRGPVPSLAIPGAQMRGMRDGLNLPDPDAVLGRQTFAEWLAAVPNP